MTKSTIIFIALLIILGSCERGTVTPPSDFDVHVSSATYKAGDSVVFNFDGNPDIIAFYSGEVGNDYDFMSVKRIVPITYFLSFATRIYNGTQEDQLRIKASNDFSGEYTESGIKDATWKDISGRYTFTGTSSYEPAGEADVSDLVIKDKPLYFGIQYVTRKNSVYGRWNVCRLNNFSLIARDERLNDKEVANQGSAGWKPVWIGDWQSGRGVAISASSIVFNANTNNENETDKEAWAISAPLYLEDSLDMGVDFSVAVKSVLDPKISSYYHVYDQAGSYTATFVASNASVYGKDQVVKQINITITP